jgi:hypothetical protein
MKRKKSPRVPIRGDFLWALDTRKQLNGFASSAPVWMNIAALRL